MEAFFSYEQECVVRPTELRVSTHRCLHDATQNLEPAADPEDTVSSCTKSIPVSRCSDGDTVLQELLSSR